MGRTALYVLSYNRPELLACTLAGLCGFNVRTEGDSEIRRLGNWEINQSPNLQVSRSPNLPISQSPNLRPVPSIHVIDDGSTDPRVMALLARYKEAGLIESVERRPHGGVGGTRRRMIDRFLESGFEQLVQVEADVLVGPGQVEALARAYAAVRALLGDLHFLNTMHHWWVRPLLPVLAPRPRGEGPVSEVLRVIAVGPYRVGITRGGSEPFWTSDRESLERAVREGLIPADRPDLVLWLNRYNGATLYEPEIQAQHLGAGRASLLYADQIAWHSVLFRSQNETLRDDGPPRQPYPGHPLAWPAFEAEMPRSALRLYEYLRGASPVPLPEFPHADPD